MSTHHIVGGIPAIVRRLILAEGSPVTLPHNCVILKSEVVVNGDDEEILELWLAVPTVAAPDTSQHSSSGQHTIYTNTEIYEDDDFADLEQSVERNLVGYMEEDDDWDD
jgi:hypothetical protein